MTLETLVTPNPGSFSSTNQPLLSQCTSHGVKLLLREITTIPATVVPEDNNNVQSHLRLILHLATDQDRLLNTAAVAPDTVTTTGTTTTRHLVTTTENPLTGLIRVVIMRATNEAGDEDLRIITEMTTEEEVVTGVVAEATKDRDLINTTETTRRTSSPTTWITSNPKTIL